MLHEVGTEALAALLILSTSMSSYSVLFLSHITVA